MGDYSEHLKWLLVSLFVGLTIFVLTFTYKWNRLAVASLMATIVVTGIVLVMTRFGGDVGRTG